MTIAILLTTPCFAQLLPLIKLKTNALSRKYENGSSLQMGKLDYKKLMKRPKCKSIDYSFFISLRQLFINCLQHKQVR